MDRVELLQHVSVISMKASTNNHKNKKNKSEKTPSTLFLCSISIAVILNNSDVHHVALARPLLQSLLQLLQPYKPNVRDDSFFLRSKERESGQTCFIQLEKVLLPPALTSELYKLLLNHSGIIHIFSPSKIINNNPTVNVVNNKQMKNMKALSSLSPLSCHCKISAVNWKPSRSFLINYLSQIDRHTVWEEDASFHLIYDRVKEDNVKHKFFFPRQMISKSVAFSSTASLGETSFEDISDYLRLFNVYALGHKDRKMRVAIPKPEINNLNETAEEALDPGDSATKGNKRSTMAAVVPGSIAWQQQKEIEQREQPDNINMIMNKDIRELPVKARTVGWKIVGQLHSVQEEDDDEDELFAINQWTDLSKSRWFAAMLSARGLTGSSSVRVQRKIFDQESGEFVAVVKEQVYGICYSATVLMSAATGQERIMCEGVTLFPSLSWTRWALMCSGVLLDGASGDMDEEGEAASKNICSSVFNVLQTLKNYPVEKKQEVIDLIEVLFEL